MEEAASLVQGKTEVKNEATIEAENTSESQARDDDADEHQDAPDTLSMSDFSRRIHHPFDYKMTLPFLYGNDDEGNARNAPESSLSYIPWRLRLMEQVASSKKGEANGNTNEEKSSDDNPTEDSLVFSPCTYLELRRQQNDAWASDRLKEGNEQLFINPNMAETKFLEGLDLVPDHADLLTAHAKLLITNNDFAAAETKLKRALETDPDHKLAQKTQLELVRIKEGRMRMEQQQQNLMLRNNAPKYDFLSSRNVEVAKGNSAYNDALMERALVMGDDADCGGNGASDDDDSSRSRRRKKKSKKDRKQKKKKRKRHRRKRRRRYYSSESDEDDSSRSVVSGGDASDDCKKKENDDDLGDKGNILQEKDQKEERSDVDSTEDRRRRKDRKRSRHRGKRRRGRYSSESENDHDEDGSRTVSSKNGGSHDEDAVRKNINENDVGSKGGGTAQENQTEERSDDSSRNDRRSRKRHRHRDDRKRRSHKKHRRRDSS